MVILVTFHAANPLEGRLSSARYAPISSVENRVTPVICLAFPAPSHQLGASVRNVSSPHLARVTKYRGIARTTSFCEYGGTKPRMTPTWFALSKDRPLFAFAGLRTRWRGVRGPKSAPVEGEHELFGFLTTEANAIIAPIHPRAMPVILTTAEEFDLWLEGETVEALKLQRPLSDEMLDIVARGEKEDPAPVRDDHLAAHARR
jgi:putative SOS response-associated peptidase YedK